MQKHLIIFGLLFLTAISCTPVKLISTEQSGQTDMSQYKTFAFAQLSKRVKVNRANSESIEEYVRYTIAERLKAQGFTLSEENPDLLIDVRTNLLDYQKEQRNDSRSFGRRSFYYTYPYSYGYGPRGSQIQTSSSMEANISVTLADADKKLKLGEGKAVAKMTSKPKKSILRLNEAVDLLMGELIQE